MVDSAPSVGILRCSKNQLDVRDIKIQQKAESLSLAGASLRHAGSQRKEEEATWRDTQIRQRESEGKIGTKASN